LLAVVEHDLGNTTGYDLVRLLRQRVTC
jgi:hypothetical protein